MESVHGNTMHSTTGLVGLLENPALFELWQQIVGAEKWKKRIASEFMKPFYGARILDIGCGTGAMLKYIPLSLKAEYTGCDVNLEYIRRAEKRFKGRGSFICCNADSIPASATGLDFVLCIAVLHHLTDETCLKLMALAAKRLNRNGKLLIVEPVRTARQSMLEKFLMRNDRGKNIKSENEYRQFARQYFSSAESRIISDSHFIPWTSIVISCNNSG